MEIRRSIWRLLMEKKAARFPGAAGRIPNFIGAEACARLLGETSHWKKAKVVKINPDLPQRAIRQRALAEGKIVYMAVPRLRSAKPFIELDPKKLGCSPYVASSIKGAEFALLVQNKKVNAKTPIVTSVHALQIVEEEIPMTEHDIPLTAIVAPNEVIEVTASYPRPKRIYWSALPQDKIDDIPVLEKLRRHAT